MILSVHHVSFLVEDLTRAQHFYQQVLGLQPSLQRPKMSFEGVWYDISPNQQIHLMRLPNPEAGISRPEHGGRDRHLALRVTDLAQLQARLTAAGIAFTVSQSGRAAIFCRDPDQNALEFME
jgi:catechol 2,3-dioxygenase-like lactoylglutathione lyase family enzyme